MNEAARSTKAQMISTAAHDRTLRSERISGHLGSKDGLKCSADVRVPAMFGLVIMRP
jgi:hypothetical protein